MSGSDKRGVYWPVQAFTNVRFGFSFRIKRGGVPVNLTGDTFTAKVVTTEGGASLIVDLAPTAPTPSNGIVTIDRNAAAMTLAPGVYWWYLTWLDTSESDLIPLFYGPFQLDLLTP